MITIYGHDETNFDNLGMGVLTPTECKIEEEAGGQYELSLTHPIDDNDKFRLLSVQRIIKAPTPYKDGDYAVPMPASSGSTKTYPVWECITDKLWIRSSPNGTKVGSLAKGDKYLLQGTTTLDSGGVWHKMTTYNGSVSGYVYPAIYSSPAYCRDTGTTKQVTTGTDNIEGTPQIIQMSKYQLFRIYEVVINADSRTIEARARHISYDLLNYSIKVQKRGINKSVGNIISQEFRSSSYMTRAIPLSVIVFYTYTGDAETGRIDIGTRTAMDILMGDSQSVKSTLKARFIRNNRSFYIFPNLEADPVYEVRYGKNLVSAALTIDASELVNHIIGFATVNSNTVTGSMSNQESISAYGQKDMVKDYGTIEDGTLSTKMREDLRNLCEPKKTLDTEFIKMELANEAEEHDLHIYDMVRVYDPSSGIDMKVRMNGYVYDALKQKYESITLGDYKDTST